MFLRRRSLSLPILSCRSEVDEVATGGDEPTAAEDQLSLSRCFAQLWSVANAGDDAEDDDVSDDVTRSVLAGNLDSLPPVPSRTVCVFLSSTFSDMAPERNALMEHVYPQLKEFCRQQYRLEFQMMDLRWGIREQSHNDHTIIEFCLREIDKCKAKSVGPNFVVLLGQKYGYRPFPPTILADEFETIRQQLATGTVDDERRGWLELLDTWFKKNTNVLPHVYTLQPISSILPDYTYANDDVRKQKADEHWQLIYDRLRHILRHGVTSCVQEGKLAESCRDKYFVSVTEYEIERGMLETSDDCNSTCLCFVRHINDLEKNWTHPKVSQYLDLVASQGQTVKSSSAKIDTEAQNLLQQLRDKVSRVLTDERNMEYLELDWKDDSEYNPSDDDDYIKQFCDSFRDKMQWLISRAAERANNETLGCSNSGTRQMRLIEVLQHLTMCRDRSREFKGREDALCRIRRYLQSRNIQSQQQQQQQQKQGGEEMEEMTTDKPLVVYGESGSGKTSVLAKVASLVTEWLNSDNVHPVTVLRFLGTTSQSCNIRLLLSSVCWQIASIYGQRISDLPNDYPSLVIHFHQLLTFATAQRPLVVLFDGLDQLGPAHRAHNLAWLPATLPPNVRLVLSTLQNDKKELLEILQALLSSSNGNFVRITPLGTRLSMDVVKEKLDASSRTLTDEQLAVVERALAECSLPLYTSLVFEEVCQWSSYQNEAVVQATVDDIINSFFDRLELYHGKVFVSHALSYLTASRNGLSDAELDDVLSLDDTVLNDVFQHWLPPLRRIPPLLVPRLLDELSRYLVQREANGIRVVYWYHGQFIAVARRRYLADGDPVHRRATHATLAEYYMGTWSSGRRKPFRYSTRQLRCQSGGRRKGKPRRQHDEADRMVAQQPLFFGIDTTRHGRPLRYNLRKLSELPYHLVESGMYAELRAHVLFNYDWLHSKLSAMSLPDVLADFQMATSSLDLMDTRVKSLVNTDVHLLASALRLGGAHLSHNPDTLAFDLIGRLLFYYDDGDVDDDFVLGDDGGGCSRGDEVQQLGVGIKTLLQQCDMKSPKHSTLLPLLQCFDPPTALSMYNLEGHSQVVTDVVFSRTTNELVSISKDGKIAFWDLESGEQSRLIDVSSEHPGRFVRLYLADVDDTELLVVDFDALDSLAHVYDIKTGRMVRACAQPRLSSPLRGFVAGSLLCRQKSIVDLRTGSEVATVDEFIESKSYVVCALTPNERFLLVGEPSEIRLFPMATPPSGHESTGRVRQMVACYPAMNQPSAMAVAPDCRLAFVGHSIDYLISVIDIDPASSAFGQIVGLIDCSDYAMTSSSTVSRSTSQESTGSEQPGLNEISEIDVHQSRTEYHLLVNVCRYSLVVVVVMMSSASEDQLRPLDLPEVNSSSGSAGPVLLKSSSFNHDGSLALASAESNLWVWLTSTGRLVNRISLHTTPGYSMAVHSRRNLVATSSTMNTSVMIWDLDKTETIDTPDIKVYEGPVDCVAVATDVRLIFVKSHYALSSSNRSYRYVTSFGVDVWNLSTGSTSSVLPFRKYGRLIQMSVTPQATSLALLLVNDKQEHYVVVFDIDFRSAQASGQWAGSQIRCVAMHDLCSSFVVSPDWDFMATVSGTDADDDCADIQLWDLDDESERSIVHFKEARSPVFTLDGSYLMYIDRGCRLIAYSLNNLAPIYLIPNCKAHQLIALPVHHRQLLATEFEMRCGSVGSATVAVCDIKKKCLRHSFSVAPSGLLDISKDGNTGVDGYLQVYDLQTGTMKATFKSHLFTSAAEAIEAACAKFVRLTADGRYVVWVQGVELQVGRNCDQTIVARTSTHERVTSLEMLDHGYVIVVGRKDGHVLTMKLVASRNVDGKPEELTRCDDVIERRQYLLDRQDCCNDSLSLLDPLYRNHPKTVSDCHLPLAAQEVIGELMERADVPHSIITTSSAAAAASRSKASDDHHHRATNPQDSPRLRGNATLNRKSAGGSPTDSVVYHQSTGLSIRSATSSPVSGSAERSSPAAGIRRANRGAGRPRNRSRSALDANGTHRTISLVDAMAAAATAKTAKSSTLSKLDTDRCRMDDADVARYLMNAVETKERQQQQQQPGTMRKRLKNFFHRTSDGKQKKASQEPSMFCTGKK